VARAAGNTAGEVGLSPHLSHPLKMGFDKVLNIRVGGVLDTQARSLAECALEFYQRSELHNWLRYKHIFPDNLKGLTPIKEEVITSHSYYRFIIKYTLLKSYRQEVRYLKYIKSHSFSYGDAAAADR